MRGVVLTHDLKEMPLFLLQQQSAATTSFNKWSVEVAEQEEYVKAYCTLLVKKDLHK
jgi:hypothetical protein